MFPIAHGTCQYKGRNSYLSLHGAPRGGGSLSTGNCTINKIVNHLFDCCFVRRAGGPWLITDMDRIESIFEINPELQVKLSAGYYTNCWQLKLYACIKVFLYVACKQLNMGVQT